MSSKSVIMTRELERRFGNTVAVDDLSLDVFSGSGLSVRQLG